VPTPRKVGLSRPKHRVRVANPVLPNARIINGEDAVQGSRPFQLSYQYEYFGSLFHACGASIMDETHAVTAAHCCDGFNAGELTMVAGDHRLQNVDGTEQMVGVSRITMHPDYSQFTLSNDICILELSQRLDFNDAVNSIALPKQGQSFASGSDATVTGWGSTVTGGSAPNTLQTLDLKIMSDAECEANFDAQSGSFPAIDANSMICALGDASTPCHGDSGGPLTCGDVLCGAVSWGSGTCSTNNSPGVFADVANFVDWLNANA
jgi:secreted trypsin-like serine protease